MSRLVNADEFFEEFPELNIEPYNKFPTVPIQRDVWELYERYHPRLATHVYEFGCELKELLSRYEKG